MWEYSSQIILTSSKSVVVLYVLNISRFTGSVNKLCKSIWKDSKEYKIMQKEEKVYKTH